MFYVVCNDAIVVRIVLFWYEIVKNNSLGLCKREVLNPMLGRKVPLMEKSIKPNNH
jgi:hypothetical protein